MSVNGPSGYKPPKKSDVEKARIDREHAQRVADGKTEKANYHKKIDSAKQRTDKKIDQQTKERKAVGQTPKKINSVIQSFKFDGKTGNEGKDLQGYAKTADSVERLVENTANTAIETGRRIAKGGYIAYKAVDNMVADADAYLAKGANSVGATIAKAAKSVQTAIGEGIDNAMTAVEKAWQKPKAFFNKIAETWRNA